MYSSEVADREVAAAFTDQQRLGLTMPQVRATGTSTTPHYTIIDMDRSDDEESDHAPDQLLPATRGRVSPSPYTANTERAKQFNTYVRGVIEQRLDVLIPISHQPRELVSQIIADASSKFPEFSTCVRKRIRTFLKSYRRSRKVRDHHTTPNGMGTSPRSQEPSPVPTPPPIVSMAMGPSSTEPTQLLDEAVLPSSPPSPSSPPPHITLADTKRIKLDSVATGVVGSDRPHPLAAPASSSSSLSGSEVTAVRQLISGYRESAGFLLRAADQLEAMLASKENSN
ncbi:Nucleolar protein 4-like [Geodia barretti]|uniref:Nucleolar protein 4-like n=1 Tax=Geodia barretti TaxID=519541 RepID=A0AA35T9T6_GEOBA|nr:Nucleolar protein 4-like [Geodia barretti]